MHVSVYMYCARKTTSMKMHVEVRNQHQPGSCSNQQREPLSNRIMKKSSINSRCQSKTQETRLVRHCTTTKRNIDSTTSMKMTLMDWARPYSCTPSLLNC